jgi:hypothetical protein
MIAIIVVVIFAAVYVLGIVTGIRYQDSNLRQQRRRIARQRRDLNARARALDAYAGVSRMIVDARDRLEADVLRSDDLPLLVTPLADEASR